MMDKNLLVLLGAGMKRVFALLSKTMGAGTFSVTCRQLRMAIV